MKDLLISISANVIMLIGAYVLSKSKCDMTQLWSGVVIIVVLSASITTYFFNRMRNKFLAAQKFDFKFFADSNRSDHALKDLYAMFEKEQFGDIGKDPVYVLKKRPNGEFNDRYLAADKFFSSSNTMLQEFRCRSIREDQKKGKVFLQLSFIPVDANGKTILIQRLPTYHPGDFGFKFKRTFSFVSFSPIPPRYNASDFTAADSYHSEVPLSWGALNNVEPEITELGAVIRKRNDAIYVFWVFEAKYLQGVGFENVASNGDPALANLFYDDANKYKEGNAFVKDHDKIVAVASVADLKSYAKNGYLPQLPNNPFSMKFWKIVRLNYSLKRTEIKDVEKCVLENLV